MRLAAAGSQCSVMWARWAVVELVNSECCTRYENGDLDPSRVVRLVGVEQVREVQCANGSGGGALEGSVAFAFLRPAPVEPSILPEDVRAELAAGQVRYQMSAVDGRSLVGSQGKSALIGHVSQSDVLSRKRPGRDRAIRLRHTL